MKRHATDLVSLIFGLIFLAAASWWFGALYLDLDLDLRLPNVGWFLAGGLILLGLSAWSPACAGTASPPHRTRPPSRHRRAGDRRDARALGGRCGRGPREVARDE